MSRLGDKIMAAQQWVDDYAAGRRSWEELGRLTLPTLQSDQDRKEFAAELYAGLRPIEDVAHRRRGAVARPTLLVAWARAQEPLIRIQLEKLEDFQPDDEWRELGKLYVEEKLRWALRVIETFRDWGY